jgi:DNA-binding transcriptional LysR family regulator
MFDLELLRSFVCVVDAGGFTRAAQRVHRTQSTISQQIRKLEESAGQALLVRTRSGNQIVPTEAGERLLGYARQLLAISAEAHDVLCNPGTVSLVRLGIPEDFAARQLTEMLSGFARSHAGIRLDTVSGMSVDLHLHLDAGELDLALVKREPGSAPSLACWPEEVVWVAGFDAGLGGPGEASPVPLVLFPQGCIYRNRVIHALEAAGRRWRVAYGSHSLAGVQAAVSSGLGITILPKNAVLSDHRVLGEDDGFSTPPAAEMALITTAAGLSPAAAQLAAYLERSVQIT